MMNNDNFLMSRGELKKRAGVGTLLPELTFLAAADGGNEDWTDIEIVTLKQHAKDQAMKSAWKHPKVKTTIDADNKIQQLLQDQFRTSREFVEVQKEKILIGVNCEVVDDNVTDRALMMLIEMDDFTPGNTRLFGDQVQL